MKNRKDSCIGICQFKGLFAGKISIKNLFEGYYGKRLKKFFFKMEAQKEIRRELKAKIGCRAAKNCPRDWLFDINGGKIYDEKRHYF